MTPEEAVIELNHAIELSFVRFDEHRRVSLPKVSHLPPLTYTELRQECSLIAVEFRNALDVDKNQLSSNGIDVTILVAATQKSPLMAGEINYTLVVQRRVIDSRR